MELRSAACTDGGKIPQQYVMPGAGGKNLSLPFQWSGAPAGTRAFALSIVDPHPVAHNWVHWLVINLPGDSKGLEEGASGRHMPPGPWNWIIPRQAGVRGPATAAGERRPSLRSHPLRPERPEAGVKQHTDLAGFNKAIEGKILATAKITGYYGR